MKTPADDLRGTVAELCNWAEKHNLLSQAKQLCRDYVAKNSATVSLGGFSAEEIRIAFARQLLIFRFESDNLTPCVKTELSLEVYDRHAELGTYALVSKLNGETEYTQVDIDGEIARTKPAAAG